MKNGFEFTDDGMKTKIGKRGAISTSAELEALTHVDELPRQLQRPTEPGVVGGYNPPPPPPSTEHMAGVMSQNTESDLALASALLTAQEDIKKQSTQQSESASKFNFNHDSLLNKVASIQKRASELGTSVISHGVLANQEHRNIIFSYFQE